VACGLPLTSEVSIEKVLQKFQGFGLESNPKKKGEKNSFTVL